MNRLPVIPITETVLFPGIQNNIFLNKSIGRHINPMSIYRGSQLIGLATKHHETYEDLTQDSFYQIGVLLSSQSIKETENGYILEIKSLCRVEIQTITHEVDGIFAEYTILPDESDFNDQDELEILEYIKDIMKDIGNTFKGAEVFLSLVKETHTIRELIAYTVPMMSIPRQEKQALLEINSKKQQALSFLDLIIKEKDSIHLQIEISKKYSKSRDSHYRETLLREQLQNIKKELGEYDKNNEDLDDLDYDTKIKNSNMPDFVKKIAFKESKKLKTTPQGSQELNVVTNYLELLLSMPWNLTPTEIDLKKAKKTLDDHHFGIDDVKKRILEHLAVMKLKKDKQGAILLLVGPPGTGKTSLGKSIASALDRQYVRVSFGGVRDESEVRGHRKTYVGAMPGRIIKAISQVNSMNPVFVLDEIDKISASAQGDPSSALLEVLDPEQNHSFSDHYLEVPYDLSNVLFIATANNRNNIPLPLLDRAEIIELSSYTEEEKFYIAKDHLVPKVLEDHGLTSAQLSFEDEALQDIIESYTTEAGVRDLERQLSKVSRGIAQKIVSEETYSLPLKSNVLKSYLGPIKRNLNKIKDNPAPGVVTGLAWTPIGGTLLFIEVSLLPGKGQIIQTGKLGDVMKESATIAMSQLRKRLDPNKNILESYDIHIHVPEGATPKDGPSAGVTLTTALASIITGIPVDKHLAMTGEITLSGEVLPVGGIKEKIIAAHKGGVKKVLLPKDNQTDLEKIPDNIKNSLDFVFVSTIEEVLKESLDLSLHLMEILIDYPKTQPIESDHAYIII